MMKGKIAASILSLAMLISPLAPVIADEVEVRTYEELKSALAFENYQDSASSEDNDKSSSEEGKENLNIGEDELPPEGGLNDENSVENEAPADVSGNVESLNNSEGRDTVDGVSTDENLDDSSERDDNEAAVLDLDSANEADTLSETRSEDKIESISEDRSARVRRDTVNAVNEESLNEATNSAKERTVKLMADIVMSGPLSILSGSSIKLVNGIDKVKLSLGFENSDASSIGQSMFTVEKDAKLEIAGTSNEAIVIDGMNQENLVSAKGDALTVKGEAVVNGLTVQNFNSTGVASAPIFVDGGNLTINDIHIKDNVTSYIETIGNVSYSLNRNYQMGYINSSAMGVTGGGTITMNEGVIENNSVSDKIKDSAFVTSFGTVTANSGTFIMNGGRISDNLAHLGGAVASIFNGKFIMNGGEISRNSATRYAGGLLVDWVARAELNGGLFLENSTPTHGGAVVLNDRYRVSEGPEGGSRQADLPRHYNMTYEQWKPYYSYLTINGTEFRNNNAGITGGALYLNGTNTNIESAIFDGNRAGRFGGAIYLSSIPYTLNLHNVLIENNNTRDTDEDRVHANNGESINMPQNAGGAIWYCPTGDSLTYVSNGGAFFDNQAGHDGDEISALPRFKVNENETDPDKKGREYVIHVDRRILGGSTVDWYKDGDNNGAKRADAATDEPQEMPLHTDGGISLKASANDAAKSLARALATVVFRNNSASRGGAIATNGTVIIGDKERDFEISVSKAWKEGTEPADKVKIVLYNATDPNKSYIIDEVWLTADNNWTHTFRNLPLEAGGRKIKYQMLEEVDGEYLVTVAASGSASSVSEAGDSAIVDTANLNYVNLAEDETYVRPAFVFTNGIKPEEPEVPEVPDPEVPEQPETPDPEVPEQPETPDPEVPEQPETPDPEVPEQPTEPTEPTVPEVPEVPELPTDPELTAPSESETTSSSETEPVITKSTDKGVSNLAKTGEGDLIVPIFIIFTLAISTLIIFRRRLNVENEN